MISVPAVTPGRRISMTSVFEETSRLGSDGNHAWVALADSRQEATAGMYGGWTAAFLLRAVLSDAIDQGSPSTLNVHFIKAITSGRENKLRTENIDGSRSLSIWQAEVQVVGTEGVAAIAAVISSKRRESHNFPDMYMPSAPPPELLAKVQVPGTIQHISALPRLASVQSAGYPVIGLAERSLQPSAGRPSPSLSFC